MAKVEKPFEPQATTTTGLVRRLAESLDASHLSALTVGVVLIFIYWQIRSMFAERRPRKVAHDVSSKRYSITANSKSNGGVPSTVVESTAKKLVDREVGDELDTVEEHDDLVQESVRVREIRYRALGYTENEMQKRSQLFYELMKVRRSVRCFSSRAVPLKLIQNLIKTAGTSPSGANLQPWTFCVVGSGTMKRGVREIIEHEERINYARRMGAKWVLDVDHLNVNWNKPYLTEAPYLIVVMKHFYQLLKDGTRRPTYYNEISASIAVGFLLAAIQNAGLVTVTTTPLNAGGAIRELLQRPANEKVLVVLPVGYPADDAHVPNIRRKPIEDIIRVY